MKKAFVGSTIIGVCVALFAFAPVPSLASTITVSSNITSDATWTSDNIYVIANEISVTSGATLTIQAGTIVKLQQYCGITVGSNGSGLNAQGSGTATSQRVFFTAYSDDTLGGDTNGNGASSGSPGYWAYLGADPGGTATFTYALVRYGGNFDHGSNILNKGGSMTFSHAEISYAQNNGIYQEGGSLDMSDSAVHDNYYGLNAMGGTVDLAGNAFTTQSGASAPAYIFLNKVLSFSSSGNSVAGSGIKGFQIDGQLISSHTLLGDNIPYVIDSLVTVPSGKTLTIQQGAVLKFHTDTSSLEIASGGALDVQGQGTASSTMVFFTSFKDDSIGGDTNSDSGSNAPGTDWDFISVGSSASATFTWAVVRYGGKWSYGSDIYNSGGTLTVSHSDISKAASYGIRQYSGTSTVSNCTIHNNTYGIYAQAGSLDSTDNNFFSNSYNTQINEGVTYNHSGDSKPEEGTITSDTTWNNDYIRVITGTFTVTSGTTLTINPGTIVKFKTATSSISVLGNLNAVGASTSTIYFTSFHDDQGGDTDGMTTSSKAGDWDTIQIDSGGSATFTHAVVRYGGFFDAYGDLYNSGGFLTVSSTEVSHAFRGLYLTSGTTILTASDLHDNDYGLYVSDSDGLTFTNNSFSDNSIAPVYITIGNAPSFSNSGNSIPSGHSGIVLEGSIVADQTLNKDEIPYVVNGNITINSGKTLIVEPGTVIKFYDASSGFTTNGTLNAQGSSASLIYFTSYKDDTADERDSNGDGVSSGGAGDWKGLQFASGSTGTLSYVAVRFGGNSSGWHANVGNAGGTVTLHNSVIATSSTYGIYHSDGVSTISGSYVFGSDTGIYVLDNADSVSVTSSAVAGNISYGIHSDDTVGLDATYNFWGDYTGPYNFLLNSDGKGDPITESVVFEPWHYVNDYWSVHNGELRWAGSTTYTTAWADALDVWNSENSGGSVSIMGPATTSVDVIVSNDDFGDTGNAGLWTPTTGPDLIQLNDYYLNTYQYVDRRVGACLHELGHALGLNHSRDANVMVNEVSSRTTLGDQDTSDYHFLWTHMRWAEDLLNHWRSWLN